MADEENTEETEQKSSPLIGTIVKLGVIVLVPAIIGLVVYKMVLSPLLAEGVVEQNNEEIDVYPETVQTIEFDENQATVLTDGDERAPLLMYRVAVVCKNQETADVITQRMPHFTAMIGILHRGRTEAELLSPYTQDEILRQAKQKANGLLKRFAPEADLEVLEVMHLKFAIYPL